MAVDALTVLFGRVDHVAVDEALLVVLQAALLQRQVFVGHIRGRDESVADPRVYRVGAHTDGKGPEGLPSSVFLREHAHFDVTFFREAAPLLLRGPHFASFLDELFSRGFHHGDVAVGFGLDAEVQRGDVAGHGDVRVVGIYGNRFSVFFVFCGLLGRAGGQERDER